MMIGGGSRGKDRGQWDGWGLEEASKRPVSAEMTTPGPLFWQIFSNKPFFFF